jgi:hypothetical protein
MTPYVPTGQVVMHVLFPENKKVVLEHNVQVVEVLEH